MPGIILRTYVYISSFKFYTHTHINTYRGGINIHLLLISQLGFQKINFKFTKLESGGPYTEKYACLCYIPNLFSLTCTVNLNFIIKL